MFDHNFGELWIEIIAEFEKKNSNKFEYQNLKLQNEWLDKYQFII